MVALGGDGTRIGNSRRDRLVQSIRTAREHQPEPPGRGRWQRLVAVRFEDGSAVDRVDVTAIDVARCAADDADHVTRLAVLAEVFDDRTEVRAGGRDDQVAGGGPEPHDRGSEG